MLMLSQRSQGKRTEMTVLTIKPTPSIKQVNGDSTPTSMWIMCLKVDLSFNQARKSLQLSLLLTGRMPDEAE